ncbi:LysM peptidoglycan-binding domain-containing protein [Patescibacteria group bacterium]|nr:LysM peptidoglycan-binding domain-containing protein [Patescibacteria group bacterium]
MADTEKKEGKDGLSLIIGGIFILTLVFATYNYFNKGREVNDTENGEESIFEGQLGDLNGEGITETREGQALGIGGPDMTQPEWIPNDYQEGDIEGDTHTVVEGDTLWEIAEAVYGSGFEWGKILEANKDSIGFLPNGTQALIIPGQVLVLP